MSAAPHLTLRRAAAGDLSAVVSLFRVAFRSALPHFPELHSEAEDLDFFSRTLSKMPDVWLAEVGHDFLAGFIGFRPGAVDHLYVHPEHHRMGVGTTLLRQAMAVNEELKLWTFQDNAGARAFYERQGFACDRMTEGMGNEARMPDMRYAWRR